MAIPPLDGRPTILVIAGPNGAGKTTFYRAHLAAFGLRFLNADVVAAAARVDAVTAAEIAGALRRELVARRESFIFETVLSDPVGDKIGFLTNAVADDYTVVLYFIGLSGPDASIERVAMRVSKGGHDVPTDRLIARFPRTLANLDRAIRTLPHVLVFDNGGLTRPYRPVAAYRDGKPVFVVAKPPKWLRRGV